MKEANPYSGAELENALSWITDWDNKDTKKITSSLLSKKKKFVFTQRNRKLIQLYCNYILTFKTKYHVSCELNHLRVHALFLEKDFDKCERTDIEKLVAVMKDELKPSSMFSHAISLQLFYRWLDKYLIWERWSKAKKGKEPDMNIQEGDAYPSII